MRWVYQSQISANRSLRSAKTIAGTDTAGPRSPTTCRGATSMSCQFQNDRCWVVRVFLHAPRRMSSRSAGITLQMCTDMIMIRQVTWHSTIADFHGSGSLVPARS